MKKRSPGIGGGHDEINLKKELLKIEKSKTKDIINV